MATKIVYGSMSPAIAIQDLRNRVGKIPENVIEDPETKSDGQVLTYDEDQSKWVAEDPLSSAVLSVNGMTGHVTGLEMTSNKVNSISTSSTDDQYPTAKCMYDIIGDVESILEELL